MGTFESIFDVGYLITVIVISLLVLRKGNTREILIFAVMGLLLGIGDAFHLIPRVLGHLTTGLEDYQFYLGFGKLITSVTVTLFYILLFLFYEERLGKNKKILTQIYILVVIRFLLIALPGNDWFSNDSTLFYSVLRNIPFLVLGAIIVIEFYKSKDKLFTKFAHWIIVSFICYAVVVLGAGFIPALGAFMLPKTVAYLIIVILGYKAIKTQ